jgi:putative transposase
VLYKQARRHAGRAACPSVVIMDGQSVKTTERGGARGFDAHKRVKGRKRHILVDTLGLLVANRVEPADTSDRRAGALLLGGLSALFPRIRTVIADAGHQSRKLARTLKQDQGWQLRIVKRRQRAFKITGLTWIVERSFAWLGRNRRLSKDYEYRVQTSAHGDRAAAISAKPAVDLPDASASNCTVMPSADSTVRFGRPKRWA